MPNKPSKTKIDHLEIPDAVLDQILAHYEKPEDLLGRGGIFDRLKERIVQRILEGELTAHLGFSKGEPRPEGQGNTRNGFCPPKTKGIKQHPWNQ